MRAVSRIVAILALAALSPAVPAQISSYPSRPIRLVVPFTAGGGVDSVARLIAQSLSGPLGQQVVIDNRGGAGGVIGMEIVARAAPDGYTLLMSHVGFTAMPGLYPKLPFDPVKDFDGVVVVATGIYVLVVNPAVPLKSVGEIITYAKANPGKLAFASGGTGTTIHLAGELFMRAAGIDLLHVPYKGAAPALTDVIAGQVQMMFGTATNTLPLAKAGKLRALAVTSAKRSALAPELPTVAENGLPGFDVVGWYGLAATAKTPKALVDKLNAESNRVIHSAELNERLRTQGLEPAGSTPEAASALIKTDVARWTKVIREAGITGE